MCKDSVLFMQKHLLIYQILVRSCSFKSQPTDYHHPWIPYTVNFQGRNFHGFHDFSLNCETYTCEYGLVIGSTRSTSMLPHKFISLFGSFAIYSSCSPWIVSNQFSMWLLSDYSTYVAYFPIASITDMSGQSIKL